MIQFDIGLKDKVFRIGTVVTDKRSLPDLVARQLHKYGYVPEDYSVKSGHSPSKESVALAYSKLQRIK